MKALKMLVSPSLGGGEWHTSRHWNFRGEFCEIL